MEFNEKLQELRRKNGLTQEELAARLFVSRAAVSKWESGRGYPNIESLKDISRLFGVSVDDLLSGEKLLFIAEAENNSRIRKIRDFIFAFSDLLAAFMVFLPLYPNETDGFVYSVSLPDYVQVSQMNLRLFWIAAAGTFLTGALRLALIKLKSEKIRGGLTALSVALSVFSVLVYGLSAESYALVISFLLLLIKGMALFKMGRD